MASNGTVGVKRPYTQGNGAPPPRKRPAGDDDDLIEDAFGMDGVEDDVEEMLAQVEEVEEGALGEAGKNWQRPPPPPLNPATDTLLFQQLEVDYASGPPNKAYYKEDLQEAPVLRMYGVNEHGEWPGRSPCPAPAVAPPCEGAQDGSN